MTDTSLIERYLSAEQMQEIAEDEFREHCRRYFSDNPSAAIGNVAYSIVRDMVAEVLGGDADQLIRDKAIDVINNLSQFTVFHQPHPWDKKPSPAWSLLQDCVRENKDELQKRIAHHVRNLSKAEALEVIKSAKMTIQTGA